MDEKRDQLIQYIMEVQSIAQSGLFYVKDVYDRERFERLRDISAEMMAIKTELPLETVKTLFCSDYGYQTPKVDTRAAIFQNGKILLVHEKNGTWSMPGGWCEFDMSPVENTIKEAKEEAGAEITDLELLSYPSPTSSGLSDEINSVVLGRIVSLGENCLEEFEDISVSLVPAKQVKEMLKDEKYHFPLNVRMVFLYLIERFKI